MLAFHIKRTPSTNELMPLYSVTYGNKGKLDIYQHDLDNTKLAGLHTPIKCALIFIKTVELNLSGFTLCPGEISNSEYVVTLTRDKGYTQYKVIE